MNRIIFLSIFIYIVFACSNSNDANNKNRGKNSNENIEKLEIIPGAERTDDYLHLISGLKVAVLTNQTGLVADTHLVDTLLSVGVELVKIFCPEHGFRGIADAGEKIGDSFDEKTGIPIVSLYGANNKPTQQQLRNVEIIIFDLQDVGVRFYTYISTLHYVMEACAENNIPLIVLDRPNPNAYYIDGPVLDTSIIKSFVGMHPVPVVYGMTIGEYAKMLNGEKWLANGIQCDLTVIPNKNYSHQMKYDLPVKPSPNLPNKRAIELYPSLCFFEGTVLSIGRGTDKQFQVIGHPGLKNVENINYSFTPSPQPGAQNPKLNGKLCYGFDLSMNNDFFEDSDNAKLNLSLLIKTYELFPDKNNFFLKNNFFDLLAGNRELRKQIKNQVSEEQIRASWEPQLSEFKEIRKKYLIYKE